MPTAGRGTVIGLRIKMADDASKESTAEPERATLQLVYTNTLLQELAELAIDPDAMDRDSEVDIWGFDSP